MGLWGHDAASAPASALVVARAPDPDAWSHGLIECSDACAYLGVLACPCAVWYDVYGKAVARDGPHALAPHDTVAAAASYLLSCLLCAACATTATQGGFRVLDSAVDLYQGGDRRDGSILSAVLHALRGGPEWMHDGEGYDVDPHESEDWWVLRWFLHHTRELLYALCECRACCCGAPRLPLCYVCTVACCYPCCVCPVTCLLRTYIVRARGLREGACETCAVALCCTPCALVQMSREVERAPPPSAPQTRAPWVPSTMAL